MFHGGGGGPLSVIAGVLGSVLSLAAAGIALVVIVGVLFLLVRFLWFGTRAAQVYLVKNGDSARFRWPAPPLDGEPTTTTPTAAPSAAPAPAPSGDESGASGASDTRPYDTAPDGPVRAPRKPKSPPGA